MFILFELTQIGFERFLLSAILSLGVATRPDIRNNIPVIPTFAFS